MRPKTTPKDFFLWAGAMIALYWSVIAFIFLMFNYINYAFPNPLQYLSDPYSSGIPYEMSSIVVLLPLYLLLAWLIRRDIAHDKTRAEIWVRRWAIILTLFVAGATAAVDIIILLTSFFRGEELTTAFLLKIVVVFLVAAMAFMHFIADLWGYWEKYPTRKLAVMIAVIILAVVSIVGGFFIVGTPQQARLMRFDDQRVNDLQNIQYQLVSYWQAKQKMPISLSELNNSISGITVPTDPQTGASYEYLAKEGTSFELCATFNAGSRSDYSSNVRAIMPVGPYGTSQDNWQHGAGRTCFERTIDPELYPPIKK